MTVLDQDPVRLRQGTMEQAVFRANRRELARAKEILGYRSVQEMVVDTVESAVEEALFRQWRVTAQRDALTLIGDFDISDLGAITRFSPATDQ